MTYFSKSRTNSRVMFYATGCEDLYQHQQPHFLDSCFLCNKPLKPNRDIFMYRGDTPFCSDDCRQQQIERDEAKERSWKNHSASSYRNLRKSEIPSTKSASKKPLQTGTVVGA